MADEKGYVSNEVTTLTSQMAFKEATRRTLDGLCTAVNLLMDEIAELNALLADGDELIDDPGETTDDDEKLEQQEQPVSAPQEGDDEHE